MFHLLKPHHHAHFWRIGLPRTRAPFIRCSEEEYQEAHQLWSQHGHLSPEELHTRVLAHLAWAQHAEKERKKNESQGARNEARFLKWLAIFLALLALILAARPARAQFSHINTITLQNNDGSQAAFFASPFILKVGSNCTWSVTNTVATFNCSGSAGSVAWDSILSPAAGGLTLQQFANGNDFWIVKRKTDTAPTGTFFRFQTAAGADVCALSITGAFTTCTLPYANLTSVPSTFAPTAHNLLSASHGDTSAHTVVRGDLIAGIGASPSWTAVAKGGTNTYPKWNSSGDVVASTNPASGTGACAAHNFETTDNADTAPTCAQPVFPDISGTATTSQLPGSGATTVAGQTCTLGSTCTVTHVCEFGLGDGANAITSGSSYTGSGCFNDLGATYTITGIRCFTDNNGTTTTNPTNDAGTALLTGALTCTNAFAAGTQSATTTIATSHWIKFPITADGTTKTITVEVTLTR